MKRELTTPESNVIYCFKEKFGIKKNIVLVPFVEKGESFILPKMTFVGRTLSNDLYHSTFDVIVRVEFFDEHSLKIQIVSDVSKFLS